MQVGVMHLCSRKCISCEFELGSRVKEGKGRKKRKGKGKEEERNANL